MRLCCDDKSDPGYGPWQDTLRDRKIAMVFLDGVPVVKPTMADEEAGTVRRPVLNNEGLVQVSPDNPEQIWIETVKGDVRIELEDRK